MNAYKNQKPHKITGIPVLLTASSIFVRACTCVFVSVRAFSH